MTQNPQSAIPNLKSFATLRGLVRKQAPAERCDVCGVGLPDDHAHLFEPTNRKLICVCAGCSVNVGDQAGTPYRRVPRQARFLPDFRLTDAQWDSLLIPVGMAFFFHNTPAGKVLAFYPSPAGATESMLGFESWTEIVRANPVLQEMLPDVEALLVNRLKNAQECYLAPIDKCYELVGLLRANWRGLSGGTEVWEEIGRFYTRLKEQAAIR